MSHNNEWIMKTFFDFVAPVYERFHFGARKTFKRIEAIADFKTTDVVLDLGGGTGRTAKLLVGKVKSITIIEKKSYYLVAAK